MKNYEKLIKLYNLMMKDVKNCLTPELEKEMTAYLTVPVAETIQDVMLGASSLAIGMMSISSSVPETDDTIRFSAIVIGYTELLKGVTNE